MRFPKLAFLAPWFLTSVVTCQDEIESKKRLELSNNENRDEQAGIQLDQIQERQLQMGVVGFRPFAIIDSIPRAQQKAGSNQPTTSRPTPMPTPPSGPTTLRPTPMPTPPSGPTPMPTQCGSGSNLFGLQCDCNSSVLGKFNICMYLKGTAANQNESWMSTVISAKTRWERVITTDALPYATPKSDITGVTTPLPNEVDDIYIAFTVTSTSTPAWSIDYRTGGFPVATSISWPKAWIDQNDPNFQNQVFGVIGAVLGFGDPTMWQKAGWKNGDTGFKGTNAITQINNLGCQFSASGIPISSNGNWGWSETDFGNEIMSIDFGPKYLLSKFTIGAMADIGYTVDYNQADSFTKTDMGTSAQTKYCSSTGRQLRDNRGLEPLNNLDPMNRPPLSQEGSNKVKTMAFDYLSEKYSLDITDPNMQKAVGENLTVGELWVGYLYAEGDYLYNLQVTWADAFAFHQGNKD